MMQDVADEHSVLAAAFEAQCDVTGRMAGRRFDVQAVAEPVVARHVFGLPGLDDRSRSSAAAAPPPYAAFGTGR